MAYQFLAVQMVEPVDKNGMINQTIFKTKEKFGFDSLIFSNGVLTLINNYINFIRPRLAIGKYINPTRYRQIIETESVEKLTLDEQTCLS